MFVRVMYWAITARGMAAPFFALRTRWLHAHVQFNRNNCQQFTLQKS